MEASASSLRGVSHGPSGCLSRILLFSKTIQCQANVNTQVVRVRRSMLMVIRFCFAHRRSTWRARDSASNTRFCADHKETGMVDAVSKRCERCNKRPAFNMEGERMARVCADHKEIGMVDMVNKRCERCTKDHYSTWGRELALAWHDSVVTTRRSAWWTWCTSGARGALRNRRST